MKLLVLSDVHGNIDALDAVWARERDADRICCAGDLTDYGVFPKEVIAWFQEHGVLSVSGNHDVHTVRTYEETPWKQVPAGQFKWVHHTCGQLSPSDIQYLKELPETAAFEADKVGYVLKHQYDAGYGTIECLDHFDRFWETHAGNLKGKELRERRIIFGHTHRRCVHILGEGALWMNPGSVSYRRPDDPCKDAQYLVIEDGAIHLRSVSYDRSRSLEQAREYLRKGIMMETELQDAFFFFGNAKSSREPLRVPN